MQGQYIIRAEICNILQDRSLCFAITLLPPNIVVSNRSACSHNCYAKQVASDVVARSGCEAGQLTTVQPQALQSAAAQPVSAVLAQNSALTPQTSTLQAGLGSTTTPRSRQEIRRLFTRKSAPLQPASCFNNQPHPQSRLQHHGSTAVPELALPALAVHQQQPSAPIQHSGRLDHNQHSLPGQNQTISGPGQSCQAPASFGQYAYPGNSLPAVSNHQQRASDQSNQCCEQTGPQRNSAAPQRASGASNGIPSQANAVPRASVSSGPSMRAEILMGPAATIEVNVRFHANISAALKG